MERVAAGDVGMAEEVDGGGVFVEKACVVDVVVFGEAGLAVDEDAVGAGFEDVAADNRAVEAGRVEEEVLACARDAAEKAWRGQESRGLASLG